MRKYGSTSGSTKRHWSRRMQSITIQKTCRPAAISGATQVANSCGDSSGASASPLTQPR